MKNNIDRNTNEIQKVQMVVFDWAGTTVDYASSAPSTVFDHIFTAAGIRLTKEEINRPMGMEKKAHIRELLSCESGNSQWLQVYNRPWTEQDVEDLYQKFEDTLYQVVAGYSTPIPGVVETVNELRERGIKIGSTTGYTSQIMEQVIPGAREKGYCADCVITPDVTGASRPTPFMLFECMRRMNVYPPCTVVKVGDTVLDMAEGKNAGTWTVGILTGSNLLGLSQDEYEALSPEELADRKCEIAEIYRQAGADMVIDSISDLPGAIEEFNRRLAAEEAAK
ncbi:phosphonoacetaldehyde hydrolase [Anaerolentibacter hominis]|uniref:phosphonoacetaldehyde hydrolase n=1 Tax=Anaerolentibacter hominis TaxID=3079009 RepID=UPI0031B83865